VEECTGDLLRSSRNLSRAKLIDGRQGTLSWTSSSHRDITTPAIKRALNLRGAVSGIDAVAPPIAYRASETLRQLFAKSGSVFTVALDKWPRSGQNDPHPNAFEKFVPRSMSSSEISADGKQAIVLFMASNCDKGDHDTKADMQFAVTSVFPEVNAAIHFCYSEVNGRSDFY